jgi:hypothetical protein
LEAAAAKAAAEILSNRHSVQIATPSTSNQMQEKPFIPVKRNQTYPSPQQRSVIPSTPNIPDKSKDKVTPSPAQQHPRQKVSLLSMSPRIPNAGSNSSISKSLETTYSIDYSREFLLTERRSRTRESAIPSVLRDIQNITEKCC